MKLFTIEISFDIFPWRLCFIRLSIIFSGVFVIPTHEPLINILLFPLIDSGLISLSFWKSGNESKSSWINLLFDPTETKAINDKFFTRPQA